MLANLVRRKILARVGDERIDRAIEFVAGTIPVQPIVPAFVADQSLGKLPGEVSRRTSKILFLSFDQLAACIHRCKFIPANAPEENLVFAHGCVEIPRTVLSHQRNWKRPILGSDYQGFCSVRLCDEPMHLLVFHDEACASIRIFDRVSGGDYILPGWSEDT